MKKKKNRVKFQLILLKNNALKLNANKQLPFELVHRILVLKDDSDINYVKFLMELCTHYLRIKNYYKIFANAEKQANDDIKGMLKDKGFITD